MLTAKWRSRSCAKRTATGLISAPEDRGAIEQLGKALALMDVQP
jgi:hypothetical protein